MKMPGMPGIFICAPPRKRLDHERHLLAQRGERNAFQLLLQPDQHDAVHRGEQRTRNLRALARLHLWRERAERLLDVNEEPREVRLVPGGDLLILGEAMVEQRAPAPPVRGRVVHVGEREMR